MPVFCHAWGVRQTSSYCDLSGPLPSQPGNIARVKVMSALCDLQRLYVLCTVGGNRRHQTMACIWRTHSLLNA
jgi:hypothetical protein